MVNLEIQKRFLRIPCRREAETFMLLLSCDGEVFDRLSVRICAPEQAQNWYSVDVSRQIGKNITLTLVLSECNCITRVASVVPDDADTLLAGIQTADSIPQTVQRPVAHFTAQSGWLNDPNGLHWREGKYHLYFQHVPCSEEWEDNCHWGHAVSEDLFHWTEQAPPFVYRGNSPSGSGWIERSTGKSCIAFGGRILRSDDAGYWYETMVENTITGDPKVFWHENTGHYVAVVGRRYPEDVLNGAPEEFVGAIYISKDLRIWEETQEFYGFHECPDLFPLVLHETGETKWIMSGADNAYLIGTFDGRCFTADPPETERLDVYETLFGRLKGAVNKYNGQYSFGEQVWNGKCYAGQVFNEAPENRTIRMLWDFTVFGPHANFTQCMTVPQELTLKKTALGLRLCAMPVQEISGLYRNVRQEENWGDCQMVFQQGDAFDVTIQMSSEQTVHIDGFTFYVDADSGCLAVTSPVGLFRKLPYKPDAGQSILRGVLDVGLTEWYIDQGEIYLPVEHHRQDDGLVITISGSGYSRILAAELSR